MKAFVNRLQFNAEPTRSRREPINFKQHFTRRQSAAMDYKLMSMVIMIIPMMRKLYCA